ncbi:MAG: hypothetical protein ACRDOY_11900 [Nocardioidaceae bacterium]
MSTPVAPTRLARAAGLSVLGLGLVHVVELPAHTEVAAYLGLLFAVATVGFLGAAAWLWFGRHFGAGVLAGSLSVLALGAQVVSLTFGLPGARELRGEPTPAGLVAVALEVATVVLLWLDRRSFRQD